MGRIDTGDDRLGILKRMLPWYGFAALAVLISTLLMLGPSSLPSWMLLVWSLLFVVGASPSVGAVVFWPGTLGRQERPRAAVFLTLVAILVLGIATGIGALAGEPLWWLAVAVLAVGVTTVNGVARALRAGSR